MDAEREHHGGAAGDGGADDRHRGREPRMPLDRDQIAAYCRRWKVVKFELFGSVLTDAFRPDSDVDVLVTFAPDARWSLFDLVDAKDELERIIGRPVDLVERPVIEQSRNPYRRKAILDSAVPFHVA